MAQSKAVFAEVLPKSGQLYTQEAPELVLCKPKLLPLKSITLEKLEKMQKEAQEAIKTAKDLQKEESPQHQVHTSNKLDEIVEEPGELS